MLMLLINSVSLIIGQDNNLITVDALLEIGIESKSYYSSIFKKAIAYNLQN